MQPLANITSWISHFWTDFKVLIQSSISFLFSAHRISFRNGVITYSSHCSHVSLQSHHAASHPQQTLACYLQCHLQQHEAMLWGAPWLCQASSSSLVPASP